MNKLARERAAEDRLFNFRPVLFFACFLCLGITAGVAVISGASALWLLCAIPVLLFPLCFCQSKVQASRTLTAVCTLALAFLLGFFAVSLQTERFVQDIVEGEYYVRGRVVNRYETSSGLRVELDSLYIGEEREHGKLVAYLPASFAESVTLSDELLLYGNLQNNPLVQKGKINAYSVNNGTRFTLYASECAVTGSAGNPFLFVRERMENAVLAGMDETTGAVTIAVLFGDTSLIDEGLLENVRYGGIAHIFAVSGLHVGALYGFCLWLFKKTRLKNLPLWSQFLIIATLLLFYGGVCGYSASVVRAIVMCLTLNALSALHLYRDMLESIGFAGVVVLLVSPVGLFTVGFQLSFLACVGIALFSRPFNRGFAWIGKKVSDAYYGKVSLPEGVLEDSHPLGVGGRIWRACSSFLSLTLSAQIFTAPLQLVSFGYLSLWSLLLNCIFVPIISALFSALLLFVIVASIFPVSWSGVVLYVPAVAWSALLLVFETVDFSSFAIENISLGVSSLACYYSALLFCTDKWNISGKVRRWLVGLLFVAFAVTVVALNL